MHAMVGILAVVATAGCWRTRAPTEQPVCGVNVKLVDVEDQTVALELDNPTGQPVRIGAAADAAFVDGQRNAMRAEASVREDSWSAPFELPASSRRVVSVVLRGGDPNKLDRLELRSPGSCTIRATGLAATRPPKKRSEASEAMAKMTEVTDAMCACKDKACADQVQDGYVAWGQAMARRATGSEPARMTEQQVKKFAEVTKRYTDCLMRAMTP